MYNIRLLLFPLALLILSACSPEKSPSEIYEEYNTKVIQGISFDDDKAYYTKRKQAEVESKIPQYMENMKKTREEVYDVYLNFSKELAKCKTITLVEEVIDGHTAMLKYAQKDTCGNESSIQEKQTIKMINEGGWKIDDVVISI